MIIIKATKKFSKLNLSRIDTMFIYRKKSQTRVSRIGNGVHYNDFPYKYSNINCNDVNDNENDYL